MSLPTTDFVNSISIENAFWAQVVNGRFSFSLEDIQKDVHFTLSAHDKSANINFHVTRNVDADKNNKPKYTVFEIDKSILSAYDEPSLIKKLIDCLFVSFKSIKWESQRNRKHVFAAFIPDVENEARIKSEFVSYLKPYYRVQ